MDLDARFRVTIEYKLRDRSAAVLAVPASEFFDADVETDEPPDERDCGMLWERLTLEDYLPLADGEREALEWIRLDIRDLEKNARRRILNLFWSGHFLLLDWNERAGGLALEQVILDLAETDPEVRQVLKLQLGPGRGRVVSHSRSRGDTLGDSIPRTPGPDEAGPWGESPTG